MKILEMSLNKADILLDKSKMLILKLENIFIIVPFTIAKIEVRMRNMIINMRPKFEAISRFTQIYLDVYAEQAKVEKKAEAAWNEEQKRQAAEQKVQNNLNKIMSKKQASVVPMGGAANEESKNDDIEMGVRDGDSAGAGSGAQQQQASYFSQESGS